MTNLLLKALNCQNESRPPIWLMRQAGRYMPEYKLLRTKYSFLEMCHTPELIAQVTKLPVDVFGMDAAILFSDILVIPEALGVGLKFEDGLGPIIEKPLNDKKDVDALPSPKIGDALEYVFSGIKLVKPQLQVPLIGFCGAPFTVASYMIEGKSSRDLKKTKKWMMSDPDSFHQLLEKIAHHSIDYLNRQIDAGVDAIQVFDSWANVLAHRQFQEFSIQYLKLVMNGLKRKDIPVIIYCRGSSIFAQEIAALSPHCISLDWNCNIKTMRRDISHKIALQGNLDPDILNAPLSLIKKEASYILEAMKNEQGFIFNLGHGIHPDTPVESVKTLVKLVKERG